MPFAVKRSSIVRHNFSLHEPIHNTREVLLSVPRDADGGTGKFTA